MINQGGLHQIRVVTIVLTLLLILSGNVVTTRAVTPAATDQVPIRFENFVKAIGPGKWRIGSYSVLVDSNTTFVQKRGKAEVGAWVVVWGTQMSNDSIYASLIYVDRPAGFGGPIQHFSGIVSKQVPEGWIVDDLLIKRTPQTEIIGAPGVGWLVWVVAEIDGGDGLRGIVIEAIAAAPEDVPVEFEGVIEAIAADRWRVDDLDVWIDAGTIIFGAPALHAVAEIKATRAPAGRLHAHMIRVVEADVSAARQPAMSPANAAADTTDVVPLGSTPIAIATGLPDAARPTLAYDAQGVAHALWEANKQIYYARQSPGENWSAPKRIATGYAPVIKASKTGQIHAVFENEFFGNYEIYHLILDGNTWSLPINIGRTPGASHAPALTIDDAGILRVAWADDTTGYWTIYTGYYDGTFWRCYPIPNGRGVEPAIVSADGGTLYLAWQDRVPLSESDPGAFDIFISQYRSGGWSLPINISDRPGGDATSVSITATRDGMAQLIWVAGDDTIMYGYGCDRYWPAAQVVAQSANTVHRPSVIAEQGKLLHVAWDEGNRVLTTLASPAPADWPAPETIVVTAGPLRDVALAENPASGIMIGWADISQPNAAAIYASAQGSTFRLPVRAWLPLITIAP